MSTMRSNLMVTKLVDVTPTLAQQWLNANHDENRKVNEIRVTQYARIMADHAWLPTGESIKFDTLGRLMDGQHRLRAVMRCGLTIPMFVTTGLDPAVFHVIDHGFARPTLWWAPNDHRAVAMAMQTQRGGVKQPPELRPMENESAAFYARYFDAIEFACNTLPRRRGIDAIIRAVVARAFYHVDEAVLRDFADCLLLRDASASPRRQLVAQRLRDVLMGTANTHRRKTEPPKSRYLKSERALQAFVNDERVSRLFEAKGELYPLPGEGESHGR